MNHHYAHVPSREVRSLFLLLHASTDRTAALTLLRLPLAQLTMELADKRNSIPLPPISNEYGVRLPPLQYQLVTQESDRQDPVRLSLYHTEPTVLAIGHPD